MDNPRQHLTLHHRLLRQGTSVRLQVLCLCRGLLAVVFRLSSFVFCLLSLPLPLSLPWPPPRCIFSSLFSCVFCPLLTRLCPVLFRERMLPVLMSCSLVPPVMCVACSFFDADAGSPSCMLSASCLRASAGKPAGRSFRCFRSEEALVASDMVGGPLGRKDNESASVVCRG